MTETAQAGADSLCNQGRICLATVVVAAGDAIQLSCQPPRPDGLAYGAACSKDTGSTQRCKDDSLCIAGPGGTGAPFCTTLCRIDARLPDRLGLPRVPAGAAQQLVRAWSASARR